MKNDRNCGMPYPVYQNMPPMMPPMMPGPGMPVPNFPSSPSPQNNINEQLCSMQRQIDSLDRRCSALERAVGTGNMNQGTNFGGNTNLNQNSNFADSNFQML